MDLTAFVDVCKNLAIVLIVLNFPGVTLLLKLLLGMVSTLTPLTHYVLLQLDYPVSVQEFFG
jgi:hypothetical protein